MKILDLRKTPVKNWIKLKGLNHKNTGKIRNLLSLYLDVGLLLLLFKFIFLNFVLLHLRSAWFVKINPEVGYLQKVSSLKFLYIGQLKVS